MPVCFIKQVMAQAVNLLFVQKIKPWPPCTPRRRDYPGLSPAYIFPLITPFFVLLPPGDQSNTFKNVRSWPAGRRYCCCDWCSCLRRCYGQRRKRSMLYYSNHRRETRNRLITGVPPLVKPCLPDASSKHCFVIPTP